MKFEITLTWSKIMASAVIALAFIIDIKSGSNGSVFMFALPFVIFLITGKQLIDKKRLEK